MRRALLLSFLAWCGVEARAQMLSDVRLEPVAVTVVVGESVTIKAIGSAGCCSKFPWNVSFFPTNAHIALVTGVLQSPRFLSDITVTGLAPGITDIVSPMKGNGSLSLATVTVFCSGPGNVTAATPLVSRQPTLQPVSLAVDVQPTIGWTFAWYRGRAGDTSQPMFRDTASVVFTPDAFGTHHVWVRATGPCSSRDVEFTVVVAPPRRHAVRR